MIDIKPGILIGIKNASRDYFYYYLVLSNPLSYGCQWAYAFHRKSEGILVQSEILAGYGEGFHALIGFNKRADDESIYKIGEEIDINPYQVSKYSKVRIDKPGGGHMWYIFNRELQILRKQDTLKSTEVHFPVAGFITCGDASRLIDKKWRTEQIVKDEGRGQFPL